MMAKSLRTRAAMLVVLVPILASCGGTAAPTATTVPPTPTVALTVAPTANAVVATPSRPAISPTAAPPSAPTTTPAASTVAATVTSGATTALLPSATPRTAGGTPAATSAATGPPQGKIAARYIFADVPLATAQNAVLPGSITNDRKIALGGFGSDLWHDPTDGPNDFWMVTDRGPNGQILVDKDNRRTFPVPEFDPTIVRVHVENGNATIVKMIPIVGQSGKPVTGVSNLVGHDEVPYDWSAKTQIPYNVNGLDTEGLVHMPGGDFWLCEEYGPSIVHVDASGKVLKRFLPEGLKYEGNDYPVSLTLPGVFGTRRQNRGFEGITLSADGKTLYAILQSPLYNPDKKTGDAARNTRVLALDIATEKPVAEYAYQFSPAADFGANVTQDALGSSSIRTANATTLIVEERTDDSARLFLAGMTNATNILGTKWDDPKFAPSLEATTDLAGNQLTPLAKTPLIDLSTIPDLPKKLEGIAVLDQNTIAISNDNDFQVGDFGADGNNASAGAKTQLVVITLNKSLP